MIATLFTDNPLFTRFWRSRLRRQHVLPLLVVFGLVSLCIAGAGMQKPYYSDPWPLAMTWLIVVQAFVLFIMAPAQVASAVAQARESGMMDFHRVTPQSPARLTIGFLLGAPIREYLLYAAMLLPYVVLATARPDHLPRAMLVPVVLPLLSVFYNSLALLIGLSVPKGPQQRSAAILSVVIILLLNVGWVLPPISYLALTPTVIQAVADRISHDNLLFLFAFLGREISPTLLLVLHVVPLTAFLWIAAVRKMVHEQAKPLPKFTALLCFLVVGLLTLGDTAVLIEAQYGGDEALQFGPLVTLYALLIGTLFLAAQSTPRAAEFIRGIRHARKAGQTAVSHWADDAENGLLALALAIMLFVLQILALGALYFYMRSIGSFSIPIIAADNADMFFRDTFWMYCAATLAIACTVGYFGVAQQYFMLTIRKNALAYFAMLLFVLWALPILVGALTMMIGITDDNVLCSIFSCSPITAPAMLINTFRHEYHWLFTWLSVSASIYPLLIFVPLYLRAVKRARFEALREPVARVKEVTG